MASWALFGAATHAEESVEEFLAKLCCLLIIAGIRWLVHVNAKKHKARKAHGPASRK